MTTKHEEILATYEATTGAEGYLFGLEYAHNLYYVLRSGLIAEALKADRASSKRGGFLKIRVKFSAALKKALVESGEAILLGSSDLLETEDRYNKGERFEKIITERLTGETWVKDSKPYYECGDIRLNGKEIQVKLDGAELTNERVVEKGLAAKAAA